MSANISANVKVVQRIFIHSFLINNQCSLTYHLLISYNTVDFILPLIQFSTHQPCDQPKSKYLDIIIHLNIYLNSKSKQARPQKFIMNHQRLRAILIMTLLTVINCDGQVEQQQQSEHPNSQYEKVFRIAIIIGGYVAVIIGAVIFRMQARQAKVIQFEQVLGKASTISSTQHKFQTLHEENQMQVKKSPGEYENAGGDSTRRKKRKRKADRLSDRRRTNETNQSSQNNQQGED